jgi:hypothetical protein
MLLPSTEARFGIGNFLPVHDVWAGYEIGINAHGAKACNFPSTQVSNP